MKEIIRMGKYALLGICLLPFAALLLHPFFYGFIYITRRILKIK